CCIQREPGWLGVEREHHRFVVEQPARRGLHLAPVQSAAVSDGRQSVGRELPVRVSARQKVSSRRLVARPWHSPKFSQNESSNDAKNWAIHGSWGGGEAPRSAGFPPPGVVGVCRLGLCAA